MQLSHESYRTRWLVLVGTWTVAAAMIFWHTSVVREYLDLTGHLGLRGAAAPTTPLTHMYPAFAADAQTWVRHALALTEGNDIQLRYTTIDNAPYGREVHWNSAWAWTIVGAGKIHQLFTGDPLPASIEKATVWLAPSTLFAILILFSAWATRRAGLIAGVVVVAAMACNDRLYEGFFPGYVDHHGLLTMSVFGMMLGAIFMGGGWWDSQLKREALLLPPSRERARHAAVLSAFSGACGLWVSAASVIPPIALVGIAGLLAVLIHGRVAREKGAEFDPGCWRLWGRVGAAFSVFFYLLEYFPHHLGMRLEANHPLYALAWLGGGELVAELASRYLEAPERRWTALHRLAWPIAAVLVVPITIAIGGTGVVSVLDPFMANLHKKYIQEFLPIWITLRGFTAKMAFQLVFVDNLPIIAAIATITFRRRDVPVILWFATIAATLFTLMAWWQSRWLLNAAGVMVCLALVVLICWTDSLSARSRWLIALAMIGIIYIPNGAVRCFGSASDVRARRVAPRDANLALMRDIATALRASQPTGDIILLASPNASTGIGYYGRFKTLGTLYWENHEGLKAAARIFSATSEKEAADLIRERHVTHIAMVSDENFIVQYFQLLHPEATEADIKKSFGYRLLADKVVPQWLEMIPYKVPDDLTSLNINVMLFKVNFNQSLAEAVYRVAIAQMTVDALDDAERTLDVLTKQAPQLYQPWIKKGEIALRRHNWSDALQYIQKGISLAQPDQRPDIAILEAGAFYNLGQHAYAVRIYRAALAERRTPDIVCYLAWILATSPDDSIRNGKEALELAQEALKADPNSASYLNTLAAALAENKRFPEAIDAADRAVVNARLRGDDVATKRFEERLAVLKSGKPLRN